MNNNTNCWLIDRLQNLLVSHLAIIEWGWEGYEEFCRSRSVLSTEVHNTLRDLQNSSYPTKAEFNNIIALLFIQNIFFAPTCKLYSRPFLSLLNDTTLCPGFLGQWFNNLWRQWFNNLPRAALLTSLIRYDRILGQHQLFMVHYACGFNQLEMGKYFEWRIIINIAMMTYWCHWHRTFAVIVNKIICLCLWLLTLTISYRGLYQENQLFWRHTGNL